MAGFRNLLVHQYLEIDQEELYRYLQNLEQLYQFLEYIREWLAEKKVLFSQEVGGEVIRDELLEAIKENSAFQNPKNPPT